MVLTLNPPAIVEQQELRVSDHVRVIQNRIQKRGATETRQAPGSKVVSMRGTHRSLRAKAHDKTTEFENKYPW